jgi:hypothetical protein
MGIGRQMIIGDIRKKVFDFYEDCPVSRSPNLTVGQILIAVNVLLRNRLAPHPAARLEAAT